MADINDLLGEQEGQLSSDMTSEEENPLEKMDEISKKMPDGKDASNKKLDEDTIKEIMMSGDNSDGMFEPDEEKPAEGEPELHEEVDEDAKINIKGDATPKGKYEKQFVEDMIKNPTKYTIQTPYGEMTIAEAMRKGYNPITKQFEKEHDLEAIKEKHFSRLNDSDRSALESLTNPESAQVAPADAAKYGLDPSSPMVRQPGMGEAQTQLPESSPIGASPMPQTAPAQQAPAMPMAEGGAVPAQQAPQGLESLLGGGM